MREELLIECAEEALKNGPHRFIRPDDKVFYVDGFKDGYKLGLDAKINKTTISDAPALPEDDDDYKDSIAKEAWDAVNTCTPCHPESFIQGYIAGAGAKRDQIKILGDRCNQLLKDKGDLTDECKTLIKRVASRDKCIEENEKSIVEWQRVCEAKTDTNSQLVADMAMQHEELERTRIGALRNLDGWRKSDAELSKAREIIRNLIDVMERAGCRRYPGSSIDNAEEFLKEHSNDR
jgi:hypothetical protein